jgi:hypothetical protein
MQRVILGLLSLSLVFGSCAQAEEPVSLTKTDAPPDFPEKGYRPLPPHFQPRRIIAANPEKVAIPPPPLPSYEQPVIPSEGYLWVPGYWAWRKSVPDYFWVPGTWVRPPAAGLLWTPPYWSRVEDGYAFHSGYWATEVGFYGGIQYGFGYSGDGYQGGRWENGTFAYNRADNNLGSVDLKSVYDQASTESPSPSSVSYNGGRRGIPGHPSEHQERFADAQHGEATAEQQRHFKLAGMDRSLYSKLNGGKPPVAATQHAGDLAGTGITSSRRQREQTAGRIGDHTTNAKPTAASDDGRQPPAK